MTEFQSTDGANTKKISIEHILLSHSHFPAPDLDSIPDEPSLPTMVNPTLLDFLEIEKEFGTPEVADKAEKMRIKLDSEELLRLVW